MCLMLYIRLPHLLWAPVSLLKEDDNRILESRPKCKDMQNHHRHIGTTRCSLRNIVRGGQGKRVALPLFVYLFTAVLVGLQ